MEYDVMILNLQYSIWFPALIGDMVYGAEQPFFLEREVNLCICFHILFFAAMS